MINRVEKQKNGLQYTVFSGFVQFREMEFVVVFWFSFFYVQGLVSFTGEFSFVCYFGLASP